MTGVREDIRTVQVMARSAGPDRLDPTKLGNLGLQNNKGELVPLSQIGHIEVVQEDPILKRRDRTPTITVQSDIDETMQPPAVSLEVQKALRPLIASLRDGYRIEMGGNIEEATKANNALFPVFPLMFIDVALHRDRGRAIAPFQDRVFLNNLDMSDLTQRHQLTAVVLQAQVAELGRIEPVGPALRATN